MDEKQLSAKELDRQNRQAESYRLRLEGYTFAQIAAKQKIGIATAHRDVSAYQELLAKENKETALHSQRIALDRLDVIYRELRELLPYAEDAYSDDGNRLIRDGYKVKIGVYDKLLKVIERQVAVSGVSAIKAPEVRESKELLEMDIDNADINTLLNGIADQARE
jgi:hypothetical protein